MRPRLWALALLGAAACGPVGPKPSDGVILHTRTSGEVGGARFQSPLALADTFAGRTRVLVTDESNACSSLDTTASRPVVRGPSGAIRPSLLLVMSGTLGIDQRVTVDMTADFDPGAPWGTDGGSTVCDPPLAPVDGGALDAGPAPDGGCHPRVVAARGGFAHLLLQPDAGLGPDLEGVFDTVYAQGHLNGGFHATPCPKLHDSPSFRVNGCQIAEGATLLPLLALGLASLRRRARS